MTFAELLTALETRGALPASRLKDCKTSLRYLASALGAASLEQCPITETCRHPAAWEAVLEAHFRVRTAQGHAISAATRRNTRNNLRVVWRLAEAQGLFAAPAPAPALLRAKPPRVAFQAQARATSPYKGTYHLTPRRYGVPKAQWPPDILAGWQAYRERCELRLRETTFHTYEKDMATYLGYLIRICGRQVTWDGLFDPTLVRAFLAWHGARLQVPIGQHAYRLVCMLAAVAVVVEHPNRRALADFRNSLPPPTPMHTQRAHWVPLATLETIAEACLAEGRQPYLVLAKHKYPGSRRATQFQRGLMLKLLVRIPLRQRNVRDIQLGRNLYQDHAGHWHLHFRGRELKVGDRNGRANEYHVDLTEYCPDLLPALEEFVTVHRPNLPKAATAPQLFLTYRGNPFTQRSLNEEVGCVVALHTGQRFYPHLIRTIWATEYLQATGDFTTAATMLGDTLQITIRTYYEVVHKDQHAKARAFLSTALQQG